MLAVFIGAASEGDLTLRAGTVWQLVIALASVMVIAPVCVLLSFWVNDVLG
jgi:hypothetical protein